VAKAYQQLVQTGIVDEKSNRRGCNPGTASLVISKEVDLCIISISCSAQPPLRRDDDHIGQLAGLAWKPSRTR
jgi:hypothetical protein